MRAKQVVIIGAGMGGLVAALQLAANGCAVTVLEAAAAPGGKMRQLRVGRSQVDAGPTVLTMRWVFERIFSDAGLSLSDHVTLTRADILARHAWANGARLDLFADVDRSAAAIGEFAGARDADGYRAFCNRAGNIYETLRESFILGSRPNPASLVHRVGIGGFRDLMRISPFATMWSELGDYFHDPRLRQLFGRYATYCGSSPFLAPATLMLVAHVEQEGVWMVEGGMHEVAKALAKSAQLQGASIRYGETVSRILTSRGRASAVLTARGESIAADAVVMNGDVAALAEGLLGEAAVGSVTAIPPASRSLSAVTWAIEAETSGFPLARHNVFFSSDYAGEFDDLQRHGRIPRAPTVYVCAQDRGDADADADVTGRERLLCLVNAPATDGNRPDQTEELDRCEETTFQFLRECGLRIDLDSGAGQRTGPADFAALFPGTGGALYGRASHGWMASFTRPGSRTKLPGLYLAGGSTHPGPGVPMAALSGRQAAMSVMADLASTGRSRRVAMPGGMSMR